MARTTKRAAAVAWKVFRDERSRRWRVAIDVRVGDGTFELVCSCRFGRKDSAEDAAVGMIAALADDARGISSASKTHFVEMFTNGKGQWRHRTMSKDNGKHVQGSVQKFHSRWDAEQSALALANDAGWEVRGLARQFRAPRKKKQSAG